MADSKPPVALSERGEWLEPDGLGGYASGTTIGLRTRRYHGLLLTATTPPTGRVMLVNGFDAWVELDGKQVYLSTQRYSPNVIAPDGSDRLQSFADDPWPRWVWQLAPGITVALELFVPHGLSACVLIWTSSGSARGNSSNGLKLTVRPFLSGRDYHGTHHENSAFRFEGQPHPLGVTWTPYAGMPTITALTNGTYRAEPFWYRNFLYVQEQERGLDCVEDLGAPGTFTMDLREPAVLIFAAEGHVDTLARLGNSAAAIAGTLTDSERKRPRRFEHGSHDRPTLISSVAIARRRPGPPAKTNDGSDRTIIAGYPWFTDWGRDTFISLRGLCLANGRMDGAAEILAGWADTISEGMLPNRFPDQGDTPQYNSVDASLWYVVAVGDFLARRQASKPPAPASLVQKLRGAVQSILEGYFHGTRYNIRGDADGLLQAGVPGEQLTWMDVKIGDWVVTPRIGKPVEVQALWLSALKIGGQFDAEWSSVYARGLASFRARFWNASRGCLYDVVDVNHQSGLVDETVRPNQLFAIGGLPEMLIDVKQAREVVDLCEQRLWTPLGLRTLDPAEPGYAPHYAGAPLQRDPTYHQGTVWPWLAGAFIEAWVRVRGDSPQVRTQARTKFLQSLLDGLHAAGLGHLPEIADGDAPHTPRGCPFQAWSLAELIRVQHLLDGSQAH